MRMRRKVNRLFCQAAVVYNHAQDGRSQCIGYQDTDAGKAQRDPYAMIEYSADLFRFVLASTPGNERLQAVVKPIAYNGKDQVIHAGNACGWQAPARQGHRERCCWL